MLSTILCVACSPLAPLCLGLYVAIALVSVLMLLAYLLSKRMKNNEATETANASVTGTRIITNAATDNGAGVDFRLQVV